MGFDRTGDVRLLFQNKDAHTLVGCFRKGILPLFSSFKRSFSTTGFIPAGAKVRWKALLGYSHSVYSRNVTTHGIADYMVFFHAYLFSELVQPFNLGIYRKDSSGFWNSRQSLADRGYDMILVSQIPWKTRPVVLVTSKAVNRRMLSPLPPSR